MRGHSTAATQLALLDYVGTLVPPGIAVLLVGDTEFGAVQVLQQLDKWCWNYVLRQKTSTHVCLAQQSEWKDFGSWVAKAGRSLWLGKGWLTESGVYPLNLLGHWCLATNLPDKQVAWRAYARRMWIEEMFGDIKKHGFDLENTMLRHVD